MYIFILFILASYLFDYLAFKTVGKLFSIVFIIVALCLSVIALPIMLTPTNTLTAAYNVTTSGGNIIIPSTTQSSTAPQSMQQLGLFIGYGNSIIQVGLVIFMIYLWIANSREKKYKDPEKRG